ncbi:MAG: molybdopterin-binding protein, partial [Planctomycetota bacterium]
MTVPKIGILTISDRASQGIYEDESGPAIESVLREFLATECDYERRMVADEIPDIVRAIEDFAADGCALVCTTGGTGPQPAVGEVLVTDDVAEAMKARAHMISKKSSSFIVETRSDEERQAALDAGGFSIVEGRAR